MQIPWFGLWSSPSSALSMITILKSTFLLTLSSFYIYTGRCWMVVDHLEVVASGGDHDYGGCLLGCSAIPWSALSSLPWVRDWDPAEMPHHPLMVTRWLSRYKKGDSKIIVNALGLVTTNYSFFWIIFEFISSFYLHPRITLLILLEEVLIL